jgi:drug/metabolite transporter (DMT)-like permease
MCLVWGVPYLLIKVAVRDLQPATLVFFRTAIGAVLLLPIAVVRRELGWWRARWKPLVVYTVIEIGIPWVLLSTAEQRLPSSLSGLLVAAVPLVGVVASRAVADREALGPRGVTGLLLGLVGVAALVGLDVRGADAGSVAIVGFVVIGYAVGPLILAHALNDLPKLGVVAASLGLCAVAYAPYAMTHLPARTPPLHVIAAVVVLGVVCTGAAFVLFFHLIVEVGPVRSTVITYFNPAVAVVLGVAFLGESFSAGTALGFGLILTGSYLATRPARPAPSPSAERPPVAVVPEP